MRPWFWTGEDLYPLQHPSWNPFTAVFPSGEGQLHFCPEVPVSAGRGAVGHMTETLQRTAQFLGATRSAPTP